MAASKPVLLDRADQVRAVSSIVAHQVISVMERLRQATVAELAEHTGVDAGSLYYHVRRLKKAGVLREKEKRSTGGRQETVFEITGSEVVFDPKRSSPAFLRELCRSVRTRLRYVERAYQRALLGDGRRAGRSKNLSLHQHHARLTPEDRAELYRRIEELEAFLIERDDPRQAEFLSVTVAILPER